MEKDILEILGKTAGIGGLVIGVLLILFREIIRKNIFSTLTKERSYHLLRLIVFVVWSVSVLGIVAWVYAELGTAEKNKSKVTNEIPRDMSNYNLIVQQTFEYGNNSEKNQICETYSCGADESWDISLTQGALLAQNKAHDSAIHYIYIQNTNTFEDPEIFVPLGPLNPLSIDLKIVDGQPHDRFGCGLLYRFIQEPKSYFLYILSTSGKVELMKRTPSGDFLIVFSETIKDFEFGNTYSLGVAGDDQNIYLYLDGKLISTLKDAVNTTGLGGLIMLGLGTYIFDNFKIYSPLTISDST